MSYSTLTNCLNDSPRQFHALIGLDGFVDEVVHVVKKRIDANHYERIHTMEEYGKKIVQCAGLSFNVEIETLTQKLGGNGPIFALGLQKYNSDITYIGCVGKNTIDSVFAELESRAKLIGVADPGKTDAMEFDDGKIIRSKLSSLNQLTWDGIMQKVSVEQFAQFMDESRLISFNNWTMIPHMSDIWKHIIQDVLPKMKTDKSEKVIFFDLADPEKRDNKQILEALNLIKKFKHSGFETVLGLNRKEACEIAGILSGREFEDPKSVKLRDLCDIVYDLMEIDCVFVHPVENAACINSNGYFAVDGPFCANPVLTTGAGDTFNSGFMYAYIHHFSSEDCLLLGAASSGYYVRNGKNATTPEIVEFLRKWNDGSLD